MREDFEKLVVAGVLSRQHVEPLVRLTATKFCQHRSWGVGRITGLDLVSTQMTIDFHAKRDHAMNLAFAAESLKPIPADHILARKVADPDALRQMAALHPVDLLKLVLQSYGGKATLDQVQSVLVPDIIREDWKKWWEAARKEVKKDGHFVIPIKRTEPLAYEKREVTLQQRLEEDLRAAKGLKARIAVAQEIHKSLNDLTDKPAMANLVISALNAEIATHQRTQPAVALDAIFTRDDIRAEGGGGAVADEVAMPDIWNLEPDLGKLLEGAPSGKIRRVLLSFRDTRSRQWVEQLLGSLNSLTPKVTHDCVSVLVENGQLGLLKEHLGRLINQHQASSNLLLWIAKERSDTFADILGSEVFRAMLTAMERDQFNEKRSNKLRDYILADQGLLVDLIGAADLDVIKDLTRALQLSPCFDDMDKRSLLARIVKSYPAMQSMITGDQSHREAELIVSWESLERLKDEYNDLVQKKIPANSKDIAIARSYGDLRENHEFKAAKEMQKVLMHRKAEFESKLLRARGNDFSSARSDVVSIGTRVTVTEITSQQQESFTILGAWDSDPDLGIISYQSPVAQAMLNRASGDQIEIEVHGTKKLYRVDAIALWKPSPAAPAPEAGASPEPSGTQP